MQCIEQQQNTNHVMFNGNNSRDLADIFAGEVINTYITHKYTIKNSPPNRQLNYLNFLTQLLQFFIQNILLFYFQRLKKSVKRKHNKKSKMKMI